MRTYVDCVPCFARQALDAVRMATDDPALQARVMRRVLAQCAEFSFELPPPVMGSQIHGIVREETGEPDPYLERKQAANQLGLEILAALRDRVDRADDPFGAAVRLAIAANVIDLGAKSGEELSEAVVRAELAGALDKELPGGAVDVLRGSTARAHSILYLADNAGEIAFDRLLIEHLPAGTVTVAVRGAPVINDATLEDADAVGLPDVARVITNGGAVPGTLLDECGELLRRCFAEADVVISKGQGNYETLSDEKRPNLFFLLRVKCPVLARDLECSIGQLIVRTGKGGTPDP